MTTHKARDLGPEALAQIRAVVEEHDPDPLVIAVVTGSPERDLALSFWTSEEGDEGVSMLRGMELLLHTMSAPLRDATES